MSAYGMCRKYMSLSSPVSISEYSKHSLCRLVKLYFSFWPIYVTGFVAMLLFSYTPVSAIYVNSSTGDFSITALILDFFGIANLFSSPTINSSWWYMSIYLLLIASMPLLDIFYEKFKGLSVIASFGVVFFISQYLYAFPIMMLGIWAARENIIEKIKLFGHKSIPKSLMKYILCFISVFMAYKLFEATNIYITMPFITLPIIIFFNEILASIPLIRHILMFIGKHSGNIFFIHFFIYEWCFSSIIYKFHYSILIVLMVLLSSLIVSIALELFKKIVRYNKLEKFVISYLTKLIYKTDS